MSAAPRHPRDLGYNGLKMTADEYLLLGETQDRYELIDGVVVMSPSPFPVHNEIAHEVAHQLTLFARREAGPPPIRVFPETDVRFSSGIVYRPDVCAYRAERLPRRVRRLETPPDLIVEVLSGGTKPLDLITKRDDYDRFGVGEYWVIDPATGEPRVWRRQRMRLAEASVEGDDLPCAVFPGFTLDLRPVRALADDGSDEER